MQTELKLQFLEVIAYKPRDPKTLSDWLIAMLNLNGYPNEVCDWLIYLHQVQTDLNIANISKKNMTILKFMKLLQLNCVV